MPPDYELALDCQSLASYYIVHLNKVQSAIRLRLLTFCLLLSFSCFAQETVKVFVQGDSGRLPDFVESCKREFKEKGMGLQVVRPNENYDYNIVVAQESSVSGAAAAVVVLNGKGLFVVSVVRSGRWSGKGAFNASAKKLAKKLSALRNH